MGLGRHWRELNYESLLIIPLRVSCKVVLLCQGKIKNKFSGVYIMTLIQMKLDVKNLCDSIRESESSQAEKSKIITKINDEIFVMKGILLSESLESKVNDLSLTDISDLYSVLNLFGFNDFLGWILIHVDGQATFELM